MTDPCFTISDVLTRVRYLKSDATLAATGVYLWTYDAIMELFTQAPKTRETPEGAVRDLPTPFTAETDVVPCSIAYLPLVADYVLARAFVVDGDSQEHGSRAEKHFSLFFQRAHWIQHGPIQFNDRTLGPLTGRR